MNHNVQSAAARITLELPQTGPKIGDVKLSACKGQNILEVCFQ